MGLGPDLQRFAVPEADAVLLENADDGGEDRLGLLNDMEAFVTETFGGHVTRPLVATLTTAALAVRA
jgi:hypothetical protein